VKFDVIVIGGGAAGLMCGIEAGKRGRSVLILDHAEKIGEKIAISGGGRCNFTNAHTTPENYLSAQPDFCKSALARYTPLDFVTLVESHGIAYHEKKLGQLFCDDSARRIIDMLLAECHAAGVNIQLRATVAAVRKVLDFTVETNLGGFSCDSLVIATGGLSFPKLGATGFGHRIAEQFGLKLTEIRPALVPLAFGAKDLARYAELSGISLPAGVRHGSQSFRENILITHRGLSGPAILQISTYWREGESIEIDLLPNLDASMWLFDHHRERIDLEKFLGRHLPQRFASAWCRQHADSKPLNHFKARQLRDIGRALNRWRISFPTSEGYAKAEVTLGGVDTRELSSKTMEARAVRGLYFIGEVVDVTGWLGGYNFQWAWSSGFAAGQSV
jgi:hypothetical protein